MREKDLTGRIKVLALLAAIWAVPITLAKETVSDAQLLRMTQVKISSGNFGKDIQVRVDAGVVTLEGTVASIDRMERAAKAVSKIEGVAGVSNNLHVPGDVADEAIAQDASRRIRGYAYYTIFDNVEIESRDGKVILTGQVTTPWRKNELGVLMKVVPGVREIENDLEVLPLSPYDDEIRLRVARAVYGNSVLYRYGLGANPPIHIVVQNGNVRLTGVVHTTLEKTFAERAARFAAVYFGLVNDLRVEEEMAKKG